MVLVFRKSKVKLLICGGRNFNHHETIEGILTDLNPSVVIQGGAKGADIQAKNIAKYLKIPTEKYYAE